MISKKKNIYLLFALVVGLAPAINLVASEWSARDFVREVAIPAVVVAGLTKIAQQKLLPTPTEKLRAVIDAGDNPETICRALRDYAHEKSFEAVCQEYIYIGQRGHYKSMYAILQDQHRASSLANDPQLTVMKLKFLEGAIQGGHPTLVKDLVADVTKSYLLPSGERVYNILSYEGGLKLALAKKNGVEQLLKKDFLIPLMAHEKESLQEYLKNNEKIITFLQKKHADAIKMREKISQANRKAMLIRTNPLVAHYEYPEEFSRFKPLAPMPIISKL